jgi:hypothetical protein
MTRIPSVLNRLGAGAVHLARLRRREYLLGLLAASAIFLSVGTVTALWPNPFFIRMTPTSGMELPLLAIEALLAGLYLGIRRTSCALPSAGAGGLLTFLGVACPICNKLLVLLFGSGLLLAYLEPYRSYLGAAGLALTAVALLLKSAASATDTAAIAPAPEIA